MSWEHRKGMQEFALAAAWTIGLTVTGCKMLPFGGTLDSATDSQAMPPPRDAAVVDLPLSPDLATTCSNARRDNGETDVDCGGRCAPCPESSLCAWAADCRKGVCVDGRCASHRFFERTKLPVAAFTVLVADVTGDGLRDLIVGKTGRYYDLFERIKSGDFRLLRADSYGDAKGGTVRMCLGDVTGDGKLDLVAGTPLDPEVFILAGSGLGHFVPFSQHRVTANPHPGEGRSLSCGDFDGDGDVDVAVGGTGEGVVLLRNQGKGNLTVQLMALPAGGEVGPAADFDGDGVVDLAIEGALFRGWIHLT